MRHPALADEPLDLATAKHGRPDVVHGHPATQVRQQLQVLGSSPGG